MNEITRQYSLKELFSSDSYVIPIYQRNYAWGESEITQLIQDIVDSWKKDSLKVYYIGTLIVWERKSNGHISFETIDGQQRLTTLSILLSLIKNEYSIRLDWYNQLRLKFDSRKDSTKTLEELFYGRAVDNKDCNSDIRQGYEVAKKALSTILKNENVETEAFFKYLFEKVNILRVLVPEDTDLNHYFEIMNSRGEQLEKHEILKAKCLEILDESDRYAFNRIWEACANMEKYVQYGFDTNQRVIIWGNEWDKLVSLDEVYALIPTTTNMNETSISIKDLLDSKVKQEDKQSKIPVENPDRFNTVINFSNFLLQILRIQIKQDPTDRKCINIDGKLKELDIPLDDKRLIDSFDPFLKCENNKAFVKEFGYNLLKGKFLFDKYIVKREFAKGTGNWSLKRLKSDGSYVNTFSRGETEDNNDLNQEILMLLSMFHVSAPTLVYKHWLSGALKYVFENEVIVGEEYKLYLENLAKAFLHRRFLSANPASYYDIIHGDEAVSQKTNFNIEHTEDERKKLDCGTSVDNFIFNYLDYLLWQNYRNGGEYFEIEGKEAFKDPRINEFEYTFRSSIEHYYPQNPIDSNMKLKGEEEIWLDNFGNLCLISSSKNSRLSNYMPNAKKEHYQNSPSIDSIKQRIMMKYDSWDTNGENNKNEIEEHGNMMKELLLK